MSDTTCRYCGERIVWRPYPALPFPEVASEAQLRRQEKGGRWTHPHPHDGSHDERCSTSAAPHPNHKEEAP